MENTRDLAELIDRLKDTENSVRRDAAAEFRVFDLSFIYLLFTKSQIVLRKV
jgi:hypothetical protein